MNLLLHSLLACLTKTTAAQLSQPLMLDSTFRRSFTVAEFKPVRVVFHAEAKRQVEIIL